LTESITHAKADVTSAKDPGDIVKSCQAVEQHGEELIALHKSFNLQPSQELLDLIEMHKKKREGAQE
jgi:hypothetical protein